MAVPNLDPMSLWEGNRKVEQFSKSEYFSSREARFDVWINNHQVYKLFGNEDKATKVEKRTSDAIAANVPTPAMNIIAGTWIDEKGNPNKVWAGVTEQLDGRKFQLSKGHLGMIKKEIKKADNHEVWSRTLSGVTAAVNFKLTNPQGFFQADHNPPISFIDIHYGTTAAGELNDLKKFVEELLK